jgi:hypothetical protein
MTLDYNIFNIALQNIDGFIKNKIDGRNHVEGLKDKTHDELVNMIIAMDSTILCYSSKLRYISDKLSYLSEQFIGKSDDISFDYFKE